MTPRLRERARWILRVAGALGVATLLIGALHLPFARGLLMKVGGCPMAGVKMTSKEMESARRLAIGAAPASSDAARARPALGFTLDATTLADVHAWASSAHVDCDDVHPGLVKCAHVAPSALGLDASESKVDELALGFDVAGRLVNVTTLRSGLRSDEAARTSQTIAATLYDRLGVATKSVGDFAARHLAQAGAGSLAARTYRYRDYEAAVTALNLPASGVTIREQYMSANVAND